ncbi:MAG: hypothetical protein EA362_05370 [Saprospirales bacterium]|nr:MAG: hypothetical protein EA362_05370 [Saprospirales bacterium]
MSFRQKDRLSKYEKKDKRRGVTYSILFHLILFLFVLFPLISSIDRLEQPATIEIVFESQASAPEAMQQQSAEAAPMAQAEELNEEAPPEERPQPTQPIQQTTPELPRTSDVNTDLRTSDISEIIANRRARQVEEVEEVIEEVEEVIEEAPEPVEETPTPPIEVERPTPAENPRTRPDRTSDFGSPTGSTSDNTSTDDGRGEAQTQGQGQSSSSGDGRSPNPRGGGGGVDRSQWSGFQGTGPLRRQVTTYGNTPQLAGQQGVIMIRLCIDRSGNIIFQEINDAGTTITDPDILREALDIMSTFRFATDQSAPFRECGNYTIRLRK